MKEVSVMREDGGHPGSDVRSLDESLMSHLYAVDVRDGIQRSGRKDAGGDPEVAQSFRVGLGSSKHGNQKETEEEREEGRKAHGKRDRFARQPRSPAYSRGAILEVLLYFSDKREEK